MAHAYISQHVLFVYVQTAFFINPYNFNNYQISLAIINLFQQAKYYYYV